VKGKGSMLLAVMIGAAHGVHSWAPDMLDICKARVTAAHASLEGHEFYHDPICYCARKQRIMDRWLRNEQRSEARGQAWAHVYASSLLPAMPPDE